MRHQGYTLIEIMISIAIISVLIAIVMTAFAPARAKSRETVCMQQMKQWGTALGMYVADYDGIEPQKGVNIPYYKLGLPPDSTSESFLDTYKLRPIMKCPAEHRRQARTAIGYSLTGIFMPNDVANNMGTAIARKGGEFPAFFCDQHNAIVEDEQKEQLPSWTQEIVLVLRLNGQVSRRQLNVRHRIRDL